MNLKDLAGDMLALSVPLIAVGILVRSLELIYCWRDLRDGQFLGWPARRESDRRPLWHRMGRRLLGFPCCLGFVALRAVVAIGCLVTPSDGRVIFALIGTQLLLQLYHNRRFEDLGGTFDHLTLICLVGQAVGLWPGVSPTIQGVALGFMVFHASLGYWVTGVDKLLTAHWRSGRRLAQVFSESGIQFQPVGDLLRRSPRLAFWATWAVIVWELLFPFGIILPTPMFGLLVLGGLLFHGTLAVTSGMHGFFWSFSATYPAFYFVHQWIAYSLRS